MKLTGQLLTEVQNRTVKAMREINPKDTGKLFDCLEALAEHHNKVSVNFKRRYPQTPSEQKIKQFESELEEGRSRIAVVESGSKVIGFCKISANADTGVLEYLAVLDRERGKGYGAALMDWALNTFRELGIKNIDVKVVYGNEAIHFYKKYGFRERSVILTLNS